jgi:hypothetical protein
MSTADGFSANHFVSPNWRTGGYNNKVFAVGPFDFSDTSYFTADPVLYVRGYHSIFSAFWLSVLYLGWDNQANAPGWTGDPLTPSGLGGSGLNPPAWNYAQIVGYGYPSVGFGGTSDKDGFGTWYQAREGDFVEIPLVGAAGQSNVYLTGCLHSSESLGDYFYNAECTFLDGFTITLGDMGNGPPVGF